MAGSCKSLLCSFECSYKELNYKLTLGVMAWTGVLTLSL